MVGIRIQHVHETQQVPAGAAIGHHRPATAAPRTAQSFNQDVRILGAIETPDQAAMLSPDVLRLVSHLHYTLEPRRQALLLERQRRALEIDGGVLPHFLEETRAVREDKGWRCAPIPANIQDRRVEITGPVDRKMVINGLNSGAKVYMADFEDSTSPTWANLIQGQVNLKDAVRGTIAYTAPNGKSYRLNDGGGALATLFVRPRGLHLEEAHVTVNGAPVAGGLFDLCVYLVHNAVPLLAKGSGPYLYIPKMEAHREARWWVDLFKEAEDYLALPRGTIRATALIETLTGAFEMEEILYEMREHSLGLNCGRWDYAFSYIKNLKAHPGFVTPDRQHITMQSHFMQAYVQKLIRTCHSRGTFAMGGMAAQIPIRGGGPEAERALASVRADKLREVQAGHDGTWIAHPGLLKVALEAFDAHMPMPNQIHVVPAEAAVTAEDLLRVPDAGSVTLAGLRDNVAVLLAYTRAWLAGVGCIPLHHKMEDAATAEISRVQVYQWLRHGAATAEDGRPVTKAVVAGLLAEEADKMAAGAKTGEDRRSLALARVLVGRMLLEHGELDAFLTTVCYPYIVRATGAPARL